MNISQVYDRFHIIPDLREHQLRTAGIARILAEKLKNRLPKPMESYVLAMALHDLGNMVRIKFEQVFREETPEQLELQKQDVQAAQAEYGLDSHQATVKMLAEIQAQPQLKELIDKIEWSDISQVLAEKDLETMLLLYCDARVSPLGVTSVAGRVEELRIRHNLPKDETYLKMLAGFEQIESILLAGLEIDPQAITDAALIDYFSGILALEVPQQND